MAEAEPVAEGLNAIVSVQLELAASDVPQVFATNENSLALVPEKTYDFTDIEDVPVLETVITCEAEFDPTRVAGKVRLTGENVTVGGVPAIPLRGTGCGDPAALSVATRFAEADPETVGLKTIVSVQLALAASEVPQVLDSSENSLALVPEKRYELTEIGDVLVLEMVST